MFVKNVLRVFVALIVVASFLMPQSLKAETQVTLTIGEAIYLPGQEVLVPVYTTDVTDLGFIAWQGDVEITNPEVLELVNITMTSETIVRGDNIHHHFLADHPGYIKAAWATYLVLEGEGTLFYLRIKVKGDAGDTTGIKLQSFVFNEGSVPVVINNRDIVVSDPSYSVHGTILYRGTQQPVGFDTFQAEDSSGVFPIDATSGAFDYATPGGLTKFSGTKAQQRCTNQQFVITAYDAALLLRCVIGMGTCDMRSADTYADEWLSAYDAAIILWCAAGLEDGAASMPLHQLGDWVLYPSNPYEVDVEVDQSLVFTTTLVGDVSGNGAENSVSAASVSTEAAFAEDSQKILINSDQEFISVEFEADGAFVVPKTLDTWIFVQNGNRVVGATAQATTSLELPITAQGEITISSVRLDERETVNYRLVDEEILFLPSIVN